LVKALIFKNISIRIAKSCFVS